MHFFSYDPDTGFELHATAEEAKKNADEAIDYYRGYSSEGWDEQVDQVCWGQITQETVMVDKRPAPPDSEFSYFCDYQLRDLDKGWFVYLPGSKKVDTYKTEAEAEAAYCMLLRLASDEVRDKATWGKVGEMSAALTGE